MIADDHPSFRASARAILEADGFEVIGEAEALAWATPFPHLFLPDYAELRFAAALAMEEPAFAHAA